MVDVFEFSVSDGMFLGLLLSLGGKIYENKGLFLVFKIFLNVVC